jgi:hypothetical protein
MSKMQKRRVPKSVTEVGGSAVSTPSSPSAPVTRTQARTRAAIFEFKPDYTYVFRDMKRIGILAGSFLVILVILSFFLH